jgi:hypothetical protein
VLRHPADRLYLLNQPYDSGHHRPKPVIDGLCRASADQLVEYVDERGRAILLASAYPSGGSDASQVRLKNMLDEVYGPESPYTQASIYPRFQYPVEGIQAAFFALDRNLTYFQIIMLKETLDLFERPAFAALKPEFFSAGMAYTMLDRIEGSVAGLNYLGTNVIGIDRRDLFGNKYELAGVLAHEASHVLQGPPQTDDCADRLSREVGDRSIPVGFYDWEAGELIAAVKDRRIGAYHVSLWISYHLNQPDLAWFEYVIQTGYADSVSVVNCK